MQTDYDMSKPFHRARVIYVASTETKLPAVCERLEARGYKVESVEASLASAVAAQSGDVPTELSACILRADLCVFLLPDDLADDGGLVGAGLVADQECKRSIVVVSTVRTTLPTPFEDHASSVVRVADDALDRAICGEELWEQPDRQQVAARPIRHVKCQ